MPLPLRFQGQYFDAESGLHYNRHRYYSPETARFITTDPIGLAGGLNLTQYVPNPTGWVDPLEWMEDAITLRIGKQNSGYKNTYPSSSPMIGSTD